MGLIHGTLPIVDSGLTLCLDPANKRSYAGSGTSWKDCVNDSRIATLTSLTYNSSNGGILEGSGGYAELSSPTGSPWLFGANGTIEVWVNFNVTGASYNSIFDISGGGFGARPNGITAERETNTGRIYINLVFSGATNLSLPFATTTWYNLSFVISSGQLSVYSNGISVPANSGLSYASDFNITSTGTLQIGKSSGNGINSNSKFGQFKIYNRALTASQIQQNFNALRGRYGV